ncbi:MAG: pilus assembly protein PilM [Syntrophaceae bacterium]|nr:pilus assembly protein PilM [Syntrophaceae bacterium]
MQGNLLGLDIGAKTIKAVLLAGRPAAGGRLLAAEEVNIEESGGFEQALGKLAENNAFKNISCCICLPFDDVMLRQVTLPFRDDSKIKKTLAFEMEPLIPLAKGEVVIDYLKSEAGNILAAAVPQKVIKNLIEAVEKTLQADVAVIDVSTAALAYAVMEKAPADESAMILDIGAAGTRACFYENGAIVQMRSFAFGGDALVAALAREKSIEKAEALPILIKGSPDNVGAVSGLCGKFCQELKNTIEIMKINGVMKKDISRIAATGGGSLFGFLIKELEDYFSLSVEIMDLARFNKTEIAPGVREKYHPQFMNTALAAAHRLVSRGRGFNFRHGEFAAKGTGFSVKGQLHRAAIVAAVIIFLGLANLIGSYALQSHQANTIKKKIALIFKKNYPEAQAMVDPISQLKTKLAEERKALGFSEGAKEIAVADILKEISALIPAAMDVLISDFSYENGIALISGRAQNMDVVSAVKNELTKSAFFKDVVIGSTSLAKGEDKVEFSMRIELK